MLTGSEEEGLCFPKGSKPRNNEDKNTLEMEAKPSPRKINPAPPSLTINGKSMSAAAASSNKDNDVR
jgi:hypothetical protein